MYICIALVCDALTLLAIQMILLNKITFDFFFQQEIDQEAFTHISGKKTYVNIDHCDLFPYLLVNVGSGVSIIKVIPIPFLLNLLSLFNFFYYIPECIFSLYINVDLTQVAGNKKFERVTGTQFGGGTIFGFASLLTNCQR